MCFVFTINKLLSSIFTGILSVSLHGACGRDRLIKAVLSRCSRWRSGGRPWVALRVHCVVSVSRVTQSSEVVNQCRTDICIVAQPFFGWLTHSGTFPPYTYRSCLSKTNNHNCVNLEAYLRIGSKGAAHTHLREHPRGRTTVDNHTGL